MSDEMQSRLAVRLAFTELKAIKARDAAWAEERAAAHRQAMHTRSFHWQSYCRHGSYVGDPFGGDYMCGLCEEDVTVYDEALAYGHQKAYLYLNAQPHIMALLRYRLLSQEQAGQMLSDLLK